MVCVFMHLYRGCLYNVCIICITACMYHNLKLLVLHRVNISHRVTADVSLSVDLTARQVCVWAKSDVVYYYYGVFF